MKNETKQKVILGIILLIVIIFCAIFAQNSNTISNNKYTNINIDSEKLNIFYFNVGQADCTLITLNNKNILIDSGNKSDGNYIVEFLKEKNLETIDYFIITHGDLDHSGGASIILNNCNIKQVFMPEGIKEANDIYLELKTLSSRKDIQFSKVEEKNF